jgi:hypothetical protein
MASSKDYEELWLRYQKDGVPQKLSIVRFCEMNGIVYKHFETWYKSTHRKKVYPIEVSGVPSMAFPVVPDQESCPSEQTMTSVASNSSELIGEFHLTLSNGLELHQKNLDYASLKRMIEKLEVLCLD